MECVDPTGTGQFSENNQAMTRHTFFAFLSFVSDEGSTSCFAVSLGPVPYDTDKRSKDVLLCK